MSVFEIRNWWSTQCPDLKENYDVHNLLCANFGSETDAKIFVIVGSFDGFLNIFCPNATELAEGDNVENHYKYIDLLYETQLNAPILGLFAGCFSATNRQNQLVILHPYSVSIYKLQLSIGISEQGSQMQLSLVSEYNFEKSAYYFCQGHFGQIEGREFFCVAHIDGSLTFFEQEGISYQCAFPQCRAALLPTIYCQQTDSFVRCTSNWILECYSYQDLCQSALNSGTYSPIWTICLGEPVLHMQAIIAKKEYLTVLGERNLAILSVTGKLEHFIKLDSPPKCFHSFVIGHSFEESSRLLIAVVLEDSRLYLYEKSQLIWAAKFDDPNIVALQRANFVGLNGCLVSLTAFGRVNVCYLGTDTFFFKAPEFAAEDKDFDNSFKELMQLEEQIKEVLEVQNIDELNNKTLEAVRAHFVIDKEVTDETDAMFFELSADIAVKEFCSAKGQVRLKCTVDIEELQVTFSTPSGVHCNVEAFNFNKITAGFSKILDVHYYIDELLYISSAKILSVVSFITTEGVPRVIELSAFLPLSMFYKTTDSQKAAVIRLAFQSETENAFSLSSIFSDYFEFERNAEVLGLLLLCPGENSEIVTLMTAKNNKKLRVQSDSLEALTMIVEFLLYKFPNVPVTKRHTLQVTAKAYLPIHEILLRLDDHYNLQCKIRQQITSLDNLWKEYKLLQESLQNSFGSEAKSEKTLEIEKMYDNLILEGDKLTEMRKTELL